MKTLAVLSALVTIAIAAPSFENHADSTRFSPKDFTIVQREKKSTTHETEKIPEHLENHAMEQDLHKEGSSNSDARTFSGFKKPIIVKKKIGYHVYRDSEEERAQTDSQEKCRKQMKFKLCNDDDMKEKIKSSSVDHPHEISEREMVHSINIAKEAVHTFERDLQKMEDECAESSMHRHSMIESDAELHHDIGKVRQALEHIHRKFKKFDSVTPNTDEIPPKAHLKTDKSDDERRTQWKEANLHKNVEMGKNLEDNFKNTDDKDESKQEKLSNFKTNDLNDATQHSRTIIEDMDTPLRSENEDENGMTPFVQDKNRKLEIHSDSLIKASTDNEGSQQIHENLTSMEHHPAELKEVTGKNADLNNHEMQNHHHDVQETSDRAMEIKDERLKLVATKENDLSLKDKINRNTIDDTKLAKSSDDHSSSTIQERAKLENDLAKGHSHVTLSHENTEQRTKDKEFINREAVKTDDSKKDLEQIEPQHSMQTQMSPQKTMTHNLKTEDELNMETQRSTMTDTKLGHETEGEKSLFKNHIDNHANKDLAILRATSDFHKQLLNNMDFIEDSHHITPHQPSLADKNPMMKTEKSELHERLNVPEVHPNSEHLKTMMHFSDNSHDITPHLKMASMFNNNEPNVNVQFNSPQDFVEQSNVQELMPFRTPDALHSNMGPDQRLKTIHGKDSMLTELHDPLPVHQTHLDGMRMDGSSQHFNVEQLSPMRNGAMHDHQHLTLNEQLRAQQKWAQAKSIHDHQLSPMNTGFDHLHGHNMMMQEKSNIDNTMQPSSLMQMRGTPKMPLERSGPNQWSHNHGAYRSSYGPVLSPSYGSGGSGGGSSYGGSAVGVFPNANVGNCAVPILLSCSPSVVSGSLAKTHPSSPYSAPAYRSEDVNFLKKRGVDIDELKLRHTPLDQGAKVILEKNHNAV